MRKLVLIFFFILPAFLFPSSDFSGENVLFPLKYPFVLGTGNIMIAAGSDLPFPDSRGIRGIILHSGVAVGLSSRLELNVNVSYLNLTVKDGGDDIFSNEYPFLKTNGGKGAGYISIGGKFVLKRSSKNVFAVYGYADFPLSGESKGVTTAKPGLGFDILYLSKIFNKTFLIINSGYRNNIDPEGITLADEFKYGIGLQTSIKNGLELSLQFAGKIYSGDSGMERMDFSNLVSGIGYEFKNGFGISFAYKKWLVHREGGIFPSGGIFGSFWFSPKKRVPRCNKIESLKIRGVTVSAQGSIDEYTSVFGPNHASGPLNYEWICSENGTIVNGQWSPAVTVEWKSWGKESFIKVVISNECSRIEKKLSVEVKKKNKY